MRASGDSCKRCSSAFSPEASGAPELNASLQEGWKTLAPIHTQRHPERVREEGSPNSQDGAEPDTVWEIPCRFALSG